MQNRRFVLGLVASAAVFALFGSQHCAYAADATAQDGAASPASHASATDGSSAAAKLEESIPILTTSLRNLFEQDLLPKPDDIIRYMVWRALEHLIEPEIEIKPPVPLPVIEHAFLVKSTKQAMVHRWGIGPAAYTVRVEPDVDIYAQFEKDSIAVSREDPGVIHIELPRTFNVRAARNNDKDDDASSAEFKELYDPYRSWWNPGAYWTPDVQKIKRGLFADAVDTARQRARESSDFQEEVRKKVEEHVRDLTNAQQVKVVWRKGGR